MHIANCWGCDARHLCAAAAAAVRVYPRSNAQTSLQPPHPGIVL
jgi:hypothetical protein